MVDHGMALSNVHKMKTCASVIGCRALEVLVLQKKNVKPLEIPQFLLESIHFFLMREMRE